MEPRLPLVAVISAVPEDHAALDRILSDLECRVAYFKTFRQALVLLDRAFVVLCDEELPDATWRDVLRDLEARPDPPVLFVASHLADDRLWAAVLYEGGYDVLNKPYSAEEVSKCIAAGVRRKEMRRARAAAAKY